MRHGASDQAGTPSASGVGGSAPPAPWRRSTGGLDPGPRRFLIDLIGLVHVPLRPRGTFVRFLAWA